MCVYNDEVYVGCICAQDMSAASMHGTFSKIYMLDKCLDAMSEGTKRIRPRCACQEQRSMFLLFCSLHRGQELANEIQGCCEKQSESPAASEWYHHHQLTMLDDELLLSSCNALSCSFMTKHHSRAFPLPRKAFYPRGKDHEINKKPIELK